MREQIEWMLTEASADGVELTEQDIEHILEFGGEGGGYDDAILDYVEELDQEWQQTR